MKKLFSFLFTAILFSAVTMAQDEGGDGDGISFGAKAGVNFASLTGDDADGLDGRTGFHIGAVVDIPVSGIFSVQPEVVYSAQGFKESDTFGGVTIEGTGKLDYINVPILADFTVAEGFSLQVGPQVGFVVTDEFEVGGVKEDLMAKSTDFSAVFGAQYRMALGLFFQARYALGLSNVADEDDVDVKNGVFSLSAGWFFN